MGALVMIASARCVLIAGQLKLDLDDGNPVASAWLQIIKSDLNGIVLGVFGMVGHNDRTMTVHCSFFGFCLFRDVDADDIRNGRGKSLIVTVGKRIDCLFLLAAKRFVIFLSIGELSGMNLAFTIDGIVLNSV